MITPDCNLISYEFYKNQFTPKSVYPSGERDETKLINQYKLVDTPKSAVLIIEDDIVNSEGYGLKKGFYTVLPDKYMDFLLIYQTGKLKAKIPVAKMKVSEAANPIQPKVKKMSQRAFKKQQEKEYRKYLKGENPNEIEFREAKIHYINEEKGRILIYNSNNIELVGIIKF